MKTYTVGTRVFCDFHFGGKPRGKVIEVITPGSGNRVSNGKCKVKLTETVGPWRKNEILTVDVWLCVPVKQEFRKPGSCFRYVNTDYCFE